LKPGQAINQYPKLEDKENSFFANFAIFCFFLLHLLTGHSALLSRFVLVINFFLQ